MPANFVSADGKRSQGVFADADEAMRLHDADLEFRETLAVMLGPGYRVNEYAVTPPNVAADYVEHFNHSLGQVVKGRRHLKDIQRRNGCQDYVPTPEMAEKHKRGQAHSRQSAEGRWPRAR